MGTTRTPDTAIGGSTSAAMRPQSAATTSTPWLGRRVSVDVVPLGPASLVLARTDAGGVLACGAVDPVPLGRFGLAVARVRPTGGGSVASFDDLLRGTVTEANDLARERGVTPGMTGDVALTHLSNTCGRDAAHRSGG